MGAFKGVHAGLTKKAAKSSDKSTNMKMTPNVSKDATRSGVAKTPATIGPRTA